MRKILNELSSLPSTRLYSLSELAGNFSRALHTLAKEIQKREEYQKEKERVKLRKNELLRLHQMKLQRQIMVRYLKGQSYEQIGAVFDKHPKTIYKMIKRYQHDLSVLHKIDCDIERQKIKDAEKMIINKIGKREIIKKLKISAHSVTAIANMKRLELHP